MGHYLFDNNFTSKLEARSLTTLLIRANQNLGLDTYLASNFSFYYLGFNLSGP